MRQDINWDAIQERQPGDYNNPEPGGYAAVITRVKDDEAKQCLFIEWDFADGQYQGANRETFERAGFWPTILCRSYKDAALGFFKAFKTAVEASNPGYAFSAKDVQALTGKRVGLVLGEEEYRKNSGEVGKRLFVHQARSLKAIREGDYKVPELKPLGKKDKPPVRGGIDVPYEPYDHYEYTDADVPIL